MAKQKIFFDKAEIVLDTDRPQAYDKFGSATLTIVASNIHHIHFIKCKERRFLIFNVASEKIEIKSNQSAKPYTFYKFKCGPWFSVYQTELRDFANRNKIAFKDSGSGV
jgi:hypothetical protein